MAIPIQCPECHKKYQAPDHMAGKRVKCKHCGVVFLIAADARSADAGADMSALDELNALAETGKREAVKRPAGAAGEDIDSIFQCEYPAEGAPRTNKLYVFPMSRLLDQWLPPLLLAIGLLWACREAVARNDSGSAWVGFFRAGVFVLAFFASVFPFTLMGIRSAACKLNYELPPKPALRTMGTYAVPFALACAMWLVLGGTSGLLIGVLIGCVVALPVLFLLFRLVPAEAPVTFGYGTGSFLLSIVVSVAAVFALNLMLVGVLRATKSEQTLAASPFGPDFKWDAPAEKVRKQLAQNTEADQADSSDSQDASDTQPSDTQPATDAVATTGPSTPTTRTAVADAGSGTSTTTVSPGRDVVRPGDGATVPAVTGPGRTVNPDPNEKPIKGNQVRVEVAGGFARDTRIVIPGVFKQVIQPAVPGPRLAVVREGRAGHDRVEVWDTAQWKKGAEIEVPRSPEGNRYVLSPDGEFLCYLTDFPRLAVQVWSFGAGRLHRQIDLDSAEGETAVLGFTGPEQLLLRRMRNGDAVLQVWNARSAGRPRSVTVPEFEPDPARYAISPDGSAIALIIPSGSGADLESYSLATGRPIKQMPIVEVNWNNNVTVAGLAFSPDSQRIATVFADGHGAGFFVAWPAAGRGGRPVLQQLLPVGVNLPGPQPGLMGRAFEGRAFHWLDNGRAWMLFGTSVFDTDSGVLLGSVEVPRVRSQGTRPDSNACHVVGNDDFGGVHVFAMKLDLDGARGRLVPNSVKK